LLHVHAGLVRLRLRECGHTGDKRWETS